VRRRSASSRTREAAGGRSRPAYRRPPQALPAASSGRVGGALEAFFDSPRTGKPIPVPSGARVLAPFTTAAIEASLRTAALVEVPEVIAGPEGLPVRYSQ
jgi:hypothetical protein